MNVDASEEAIIDYQHQIQQQRSDKHQEKYERHDAHFEDFTRQRLGGAKKRWLVINHTSGIGRHIFVKRKNQQLWYGDALV